jgi:histidinol-phosphate phosphatase family protein
MRPRFGNSPLRDGGRTILLDRDGVLNKRPARGHYVGSWYEFEWLTGAKEALRLLKDAGYRVIVITNQAGVGLGVMTEEALLSLHRQMTVDVAREGGKIDAIYYCPHRREDDCMCRKPKPGMIVQAQHAFRLDLGRTLFVGDDETDAQAADAAGCLSALVSVEKPLLAIVRDLLGNARGADHA